MVRDPIAEVEIAAIQALILQVKGRGRRLEISELPMGYHANLGRVVVMERLNGLPEFVCTGPIGEVVQYFRAMGFNVVFDDKALRKFWGMEVPTTVVAIQF